MAQCGPMGADDLSYTLRPSGADSEAVESLPLLRLHICEQSIGLRQFACFYGFPRINLQGSDFRVVARLSRCSCLKVLKALRDLDELCSQPLRGNVAKDTQRRAHLPFIEVQFLFE